MYHEYRTNTIFCVYGVCHLQKKAHFIWCSDWSGIGMAHNGCCYAVVELFGNAALYGVSKRSSYGRIRMYQALQLKQPEGVHIPGERTVYRVMAEIGLNHKPKRKPNAITKADREASKSNDLIKRDFAAEKPLEKCMTDMTEIKASDGKLYVSAIFDCYDLAVLGLAMDTNMRATLCEQTLENACKAYPMLRGAILHSDRGTQYTSELYRKAINRYGIVQSMNSAGGRCHDNARCESMWARFKEELLYGRYDPTSMTVEQLKTLIWRYFISYWNNRRICSANGGLPPMVKRQQYYASLQEAA